MIKKGLAEITGTIDAVETLGKLSRCKVDLGIVRGIGYYDGMVFEAYDQAGEDVGSIFGGGRFDKLCRIYGKRDMPATGVAGGLERLMISLEKKGLFPDLEQNPQVYVAMAGEQMRDETIKILRALRDSGLRAEREPQQRPLKKKRGY